LELVIEDLPDNAFLRLSLDLEINLPGEKRPILGPDAKQPGQILELAIPHDRGSLQLGLEGQNSIQPSPPLMRSNLFPKKRNSFPPGLSRPQNSNYRNWRTSSARILL